MLSGWTGLAFLFIVSLYSWLIFRKRCGVRNLPETWLVKILSWFALICLVHISRLMFAQPSLRVATGLLWIQLSNLTLPSWHFKWKTGDFHLYFRWIANQLYARIKKGKSEGDAMGAAKQLDAAVASPTSRKSPARMNDITFTQFPSDLVFAFETLTSSQDGWAT